MPLDKSEEHRLNSQKALSVQSDLANVFAITEAQFALQSKLVANKILFMKIFHFLL